MTELQKELFELQDVSYKEFHGKLMPTIDPKRIIGIRTPILRDFAKQYAKRPEASGFLHDLPHFYYEENNLHGFLIEKIKSFDECVELIDAFLPFVDNWATCDLMRPKVFGKNRDRLVPYIEKWMASGETYAIRFGMEMLMTFYLDDSFRVEYADMVAAVSSEEYYVRMMQAWYFATALAKQYEAIIPFIEDYRLEAWTHNKTIQKAVESYRITAEQKEYLKSFRIRKGSDKA